MNRIISNILIISLLFSFTGCSTYLKTSNGAYSDVSLTRSEDGYIIKQLPEVKETGTALWGIPSNNSNKKQGLIYRFNGINLNQANRFWPTLSMIGLSTVGSIGLSSLINPEWLGDIFYYDNPEYKAKGIGTFLLSSAITIPITGAINNLIWSNSAYQSAAFNLNSKLVSQNPDIDIFLNPKYEVQKTTGFWKQKAHVTANVMGATILVDEDLRKNVGKINDSSTSIKELKSTNVESSADSYNTNNEQPKTEEEIRSIDVSDVKTDIETSHNFKEGDVVSFKDRVEVNGVEINMFIPEGVISKIKGDVISIRYVFDDLRYRTKKKSSEIKLVR